MKKYLTAYVSTLLVFLVCDGIWLGLLMGPKYRAWLGPLMLDTPVVGPALAFYLLYAAGIVVFGVIPALQRERAGRAAAGSAFLGLMAYATYDLTNWATLQGWPAPLAVVDLAWGVVASGLAGTGGYLITRNLQTRGFI
ncbi:MULTISPECIES: DUF2177 family protein [unclassified Pseudomonas]|uniref:DUF2177 family protein n=1 Tax=unclassified Pseudomonas TaxID=196821 RepID=UPI002AC906BC|nr:MULTISPECIES: DUF2177 family protein [unclassified Pseudomonas]MEB0043686.1 DUF2177 family protein [Pseudomonas sp. MH10]MEB0075788.1 DUF2177 family protein [Pseudomonas sp. MH10out]MEB0091743.1 DUF2177 family protein [Pseudomonas sp. CCI4.2]MEB0099735.1 DUF2177 family protein [Pseudomonas sp. CCI3.2]MEB0122139.1 DUF2177 family protein [Pseudomonas sp. CCI1.2]